MKPADLLLRNRSHLLRVTNGAHDAAAAVTVPACAVIENVIQLQQEIKTEDQIKGPSKHK